MTPSKIQWTDETINPIRARHEGKVGWHCVKCASGCKNCYAEAQNMARRFNLGTGLAYAKDSPAKLFLDEGVLDKVRRWREPKVIFIQSMGDLFLDGVKDEWIDRVFATAASSSPHTFVLLTKRVGRVCEYLRRVVDAGPMHANMYQSALIDFYSRHGVNLAFEHQVPARPTPELRFLYDSALGIDPRSSIEDRGVHSTSQCHWRPWPFPNVFIGYSASTQADLDSGAPALTQLAAAGWKTFLSLEPLCGPIDVRGLFYPKSAFPTGPPICCNGDMCGCMGLPTEPPLLGGVIVGGESGPNARPMHPDWARSIRDQCARAGVCFSFKQWGELEPIGKLGIHDNHWSGQSGENYYSNGSDIQWHSDHAFLRVGKKSAGRELDGRIHDALPWRVEK